MVEFEILNHYTKLGSIEYSIINKKVQKLSTQYKSKRYIRLSTQQIFAHKYVLNHEPRICQIEYSTLI